MKLFTFATTAAGGGDDIIALPRGATAAILTVTATATYKGEGTFAVPVLDSANGSTGELLVNTIESYSGTTAFGFLSLRRSESASAGER
ncbi:hypothetical protein [Subtercola boreus]|uniref:Uncharacterized protein n=1 Tax=Subtercola boreus TaxID=120213 RepID=A0A3E0WFF9_9MICO|nr:hypothetical protein [Subtercola boreus]RFA22777.1 hypothetical protein B7R24_04025 [Subtercola boreus]RFA23132.1 hypothetical protein B7R23_04020 [Subtercola boreus]RFA28885.1 hypothetical protein B7R25_04035 [Subtercola boreus]